MVAQASDVLVALGLDVPAMVLARADEVFK
jgi:hypothetical protein